MRRVHIDRRATMRVAIVAMLVLSLAAPAIAAAATDTTTSATVPAFSTKRAMKHIKKLAGYGPRVAGGAAERKGAKYVADQLKSYGYTVKTQKVKIPRGKTSINVIAEKKGTSDRVIVIGAHMDSVKKSPGANDNASGVGVTLELARIVSKAEVVPTIRFIGFGAEEICGPKSTNHHYGSRKYVKSLSKSQFKKIETMLSIDMVGYGNTFTVRNLNIKKAPQTTRKSLQKYAKKSGLKLIYLKDRGKDGWSDHEAFEFKGIPVAWLEWRYDSAWHSPRDKYSRVSSKRVGQTGKLVRGWLLSLDAEKLDALRK